MCITSKNCKAIRNSQREVTVNITEKKFQQGNDIARVKIKTIISL